METQEQELVFVVRLGPNGWLIEDGTTLRPFFSKERALDLANGMTEAITAAGHRARVEVK